MWFGRHWDYRFEGLGVARYPTLSVDGIPGNEPFAEFFLAGDPDRTWGATPPLGGAAMEPGVHRISALIEVQWLACLTNLPPGNDRNMVPKIGRDEKAWAATAGQVSMSAGSLGCLRPITLVNQPQLTKRPTLMPHGRLRTHRHTPPIQPPQGSPGFRRGAIPSDREIPGAARIEDPLRARCRPR